MSHPRRWPRLGPALCLALLTLLAGCAGAGTTLFGAGAGAGAGSGVDYTLDNIAYKTFSVPVDEVERSVRKTLKKMEFPVAKAERNTGGVSLLANSANAAHEMDIEIDLERLSPQTTRMKVVAKRGIFLKDSSTATELILQTARLLEEDGHAITGLRPPSGTAPKR